MVVALAAVACALPLAQASAAAAAQPLPTLHELFETAWSRQPEARSLAARQEASAARRDAATSLTAEPAALELLSKTDRLNRNQGSREQEIGIALPLWLPGERSKSIDLAEAESAGLTAGIAAARLRTAATVREAYWNWQRAVTESMLAADRVISSRALAADVSRRVKAGDLSRADLNQAEGNLAAAESAAAEKRGLLVAAEQQLRALTGPGPLPATPSLQSAEAGAEPQPRLPQGPISADTVHPEIASLLVQAEIARRAAELARVRDRANPELTLSTTRGRGDFAAPYQQTVTVGVRIPFGSTPRHRARLATALAEAQESESQAQLGRERLLAGLEASRQRADSMRLVADLAERRARLAGETRGFFEKSFRLGETDLPTRLRTELEAVESLRQARLARIEYGAAVSALRQALGLLPE